MDRGTERAAAARDAATARVRRLTAAVVAVCLGATAAFAGLAAGSTHLRKVAVLHRRVSVRRVVAKPVQAPVPPLVAVGVPQGSGGGTPPPAPAPTQAVQPPVVVSGGS